MALPWIGVDFGDASVLHVGAYLVDGHTGGTHAGVSEHHIVGIDNLAPLATIKRQQGCGFFILQ